MKNNRIPFLKFANYGGSVCKLIVPLILEKFVDDVDADDAD